MRNLFAFLFRYRGFLVFVLLEILSGYLIVTNNSYQGAAFFNSSNEYAGRLLATQAEAQDYFRLKQINRVLVDENAALRQQLLRYQLMHDSVPPALKALDSAFAVQYVFTGAKVINNSIRRYNNYLTLDAGSEDGLQAGMGVLSGAGIVGRIKAVTKHYATVTSLLHSKLLISAKLKKDNTFGTVRWDGQDYREVTLDYIPLHVKMAKGDTVVTSGQTGMFPEGVMIGRITQVEKEQDKSFFTVRVRLAVDFAKLSYVYAVKNIQLPERDSLEAATQLNDRGK